jgi:hypothetical protein
VTAGQANDEGDLSWIAAVHVFETGEERVTEGDGDLVCMRERLVGISIPLPGYPNTSDERVSAEG